MNNVFKRMGQSTNAPIKCLGDSNSGFQQPGHTNGSDGGKNNPKIILNPKP
jgi:hypothetical protein